MKILSQNTRKLFLLIITYFYNPSSYFLAGEVNSQYNRTNSLYKNCRDEYINSDLQLIEKLPSFHNCSNKRSLDSNQIKSLSSDENYFSIKKLSSPIIESLEFNYKSSVYKVKSEYGAWWPNISMSNSSILFTDILSRQNYDAPTSSTSSPTTQGTSFNPIDRNNRNNRRTSNQLTNFNTTYANYIQAYPVITIQWNFLDPTRYPSIAAAKKEKQLALLELKKAKAQLLSKINELSVEYRYSLYTIGELVHIISLQKNIAAQINSLVNLKEIPRIEQIKVDRRQAQFENQLYQAQTRLANIKSEIATIILPQIQHLDLKAISVDDVINDYLLKENLTEKSLKEWGQTFDATFKSALEKSSKVKELTLQAGISKDSANQEWGAILPTIGLLGYVTYQYTSGSQNFAPPSQPDGAVSGVLTNYLGLSVSWNIFDGYATRHQARAYEMEEQSLLKKVEQEVISLRPSTQLLLTKLDFAKKQIDLAIRDSSSAKKISSDIEARSKYGLGSQYDYLSALIDYHQSKIYLLEALNKYSQLYLALSRLTS